MKSKNPSENLLLIDIGNSIIKYADCKSGIARKIKFIPQSKSNTVYKVKKIISLYKNHKVLISSVLDINLEAKIKPDFYISNKSRLPFYLKYIGNFGNDRKCSLSGAMSLSKNKNILVVDFGTATTYNFLSDKKFKGGMITTGLHLSANALTQNTSLKPDLMKFKKGFLADSTEKNILNGLINQQLFMFYKTVDIIKADYKKLKIFITGGNSLIIKNFIDKKYVFEFRENLVLTGLIKLYNLNYENHN
ncbi:MAG: type III pantothenate kinase [Ignavibacteria bacterium]|nr:type III pantothenate kinase [Ignavibacteria bacterium]